MRVQNHNHLEISLRDNNPLMFGIGRDASAAITLMFLFGVWLWLYRTPTRSTFRPRVAVIRRVVHITMKVMEAWVHVWGSGETPSHWPEARLSLLYKKGNTTYAMNFRPISVSNCIYIVQARLILDAIQQPINTTLSDTQVGSRKGYTTSPQAMNLLVELHERPEGSYICLLDIAKAFPSTPHVCLVESLQAIGAPPHVSRMVKSICTLSACQYGKLQFPLTRGIKEGSPLSPALFVLVYETFQATLAKKFPEASFFVYVDDIVVVTKNANDMQRVLRRVQELSLILGFQTNPGKTEVFKWATTPRAKQKRQGPQYDVLQWNGKDILV